MNKKYGLKTRTRMSTALDSELWIALQQYSKETDIPLSKLLDRAIRLLLNSINKGE